MKVCKFCKHGHTFFDKDGSCVYCYLSFNSYPVKKDADDACPAWEPDDEIERIFGFEWPVKDE